MVTPVFKQINVADRDMQLVQGNIQTAITAIQNGPNNPAVFSATLPGGTYPAAQTSSGVFQQLTGWAIQKSSVSNGIVYNQNYDPEGSLQTTATNSGAWSAPTAGFYRISARATGESGTSGFFQVCVFINGLNAIYGTYERLSSGLPATSIAMRTLSLNKGDLATIWVNQTSGGSLAYSGDPNDFQWTIERIPF